MNKYEHNIFKNKILMNICELAYTNILILCYTM